MKFGRIFNNMETNNNNEIKPKGFFVNLEWDITIQDMEDVEAGQMFKNMFNYLNNRDLIETSKVVAAICKMAVFPTLDFNTEKYQKVVERNRNNGKLGGRKKDLPLGSLNSTLTQQNPVEFLGNPEQPKERDIVKVIDRDIVKVIDRDIVKVIDRDIVKVIDRDIAKYKENENNIETVNEKEVDDYSKFRQIILLDVDQIKDPESRYFVLGVKGLVDKLGWDKFFQIIFEYSIEEVKPFLKSNNIEEQEYTVLNIRRDHIYYMGKLIK